MFRPLATILALATVAVLAGPARADDPNATNASKDPKIAYQRFELANGLRVYVIEDHKTPMAYEVTWFRVGSKDEVAHRTGFAHLFEHLMFKGSAHLPDGLMDKLLEAAGGWSNAFTTSDMTVYQNVANASFLETMLWIDADRMAGLTDTLDQAKLDNQRAVVLNERRQSYENQPYGMAHVILPEKLWPTDFGYHWPTIGYVEDIRAAGLADVTAFFKTYYVPNNATMVIAGDVHFDKVKALVEKYFAWIPRAPEPARPQYPTPAPLTDQITVGATDAVQVPRLYIEWRGTPSYSADEAALDIAARVLGGGKSSRLYKRLVYDEKIAQSVFASDDTEEIGGEIEIVVTAKPGVDAKRLCREVTEEVARLTAAPPSAAEVERAVNSHEAEFVDGLESLLRRAILLASYDAQAHDPDYFARDLARYRAITPAQVQAMAVKYLLPNARVVLTIAPGAKETK